MKRLTPAQFRAEGYLQEVNRVFLHPLGLALEVVFGEDGREVFGEVWDERDDPEGIVFADSEWGDRQIERAVRIFEELDQRAEARRKRLGFIVQPIADRHDLGSLDQIPLLPDGGWESALAQREARAASEAMVRNGVPSDVAHRIYASIALAIHLECAQRERAALSRRP